MGWRRPPELEAISKGADPSGSADCQVSGRLGVQSKASAHQWAWLALRQLLLPSGEHESTPREPEVGSVVRRRGAWPFESGMS